MREASATDLAVMGALELLADFALESAHQDDNLRPLAVLSEAWEQAGYSPDSFVDTASYQPLRGVDARRELVALARYRRPTRLLRADARGVLFTLRVLGDAGVLTYANASEANRQRWRARGGHDFDRRVANGQTRSET